MPTIWPFRNNFAKYLPFHSSCPPHTKYWRFFLHGPVFHELVGLQNKIRQILHNLEYLYIP